MLRSVVAMSVLVLAALAVASLPVSAQSSTIVPAYPSNYPPPLPPRKSVSPPRLAFEILAEIPLPGTLSGEPPRVAPGGIRIPVSGATAVASLEPGSSARLEPAPEPPLPETGSEGSSPWVKSPDGKYRFRTRMQGRVEAQKRCRWCREGWRKRWGVRVAGATLRPPLLLGRRLFFASLDDRVYCLRSDNGHRIWAADAGDRISRPLSLWVGSVAEREQKAPGSPVEPVSLALILVVPDEGETLLALDPYDGSRVAVFELPAAQGRLATGVAATSDGKVVVGREKYLASEAVLMVMGLKPAPEPVASEHDKVTLPPGGR